MSSDNHIQVLRTEGELASRGEFGLDRQKAREKLQKFQLRDPHHYVLEFVQAAHLLGAEQIDIAIDADEMHMRFGGDALSAEDLERLYDAPFSERLDRTTRALRHLAIGLTAAQAMEPSVVRAAFTVDGRTTMLEVIDGDEEIRHVDDAGEPDGASIYLREKFRASHLVDFFRNLGGDLAEKTALRTYCAHATTAITLDGERISFGLRLPDEVVHQVPIETKHERGLIGLLPVGDEVGVTILQNGVFVTEHRMPADIAPARAVVESARLTKNLSQSAFVADTPWKDFSQAVLPGALYTLIFEYVDGLPADQWPEHRQWLRLICERLFPLADQFEGQRIELTQRIRRAGNLLEALPKLVDTLNRMPLWPAATEGGQSWYSLEELGSEDTGAVGWVRERLDVGVDLDHDGPILYYPQGPPAFLKRRLADRLFDLQEAYARARERKKNKELWLDRPSTGAPSQHYCAVQHRIDTETMHVTLGLEVHPESDPRVVFVKEQHLLCDFHADRIAPRGLVLWFGGELPANRTFNGITPNEEYRALVTSVVAALPGFVAEHHETLDDEAVKAYVGTFLGGRLHLSLLDALHLSPIARLAWLEDHLDAHPESRWSLPKRVADEPAYKPPDLAEIDTRLALLGPIVERRLFETAGGQKSSLRELRDSLVEARAIWCVRSPDELSRAARSAQSGGFDGAIVCVDTRAQTMLQRLFGAFIEKPAATQLEVSSHDALDTPPPRPEIDGRDAQDEPSVDEDAAPAPQAVSPPPVPETPPAPATPPAIVDARGYESAVVGATDPADEDEAGAPAASGQENSRPHSTDEAASAQPSEPSPVERLYQRLRVQLTEVCRENPKLWADELPDELTEFPDEHPAVQYALRRVADEVALAFLSVTTYAWLVRSSAHLDDSREAEFLDRLVTYLDAHLQQMS